jgi:hypothetical protein
LLHLRIRGMLASSGKSDVRFDRKIAGAALRARFARALLREARPLSGT